MSSNQNTSQPSKLFAAHALLIGLLLTQSAGTLHASSYAEITLSTVIHLTERPRDDENAQGREPQQNIPTIPRFIPEPPPVKPSPACQDFALTDAQRIALQMMIAQKLQALGFPPEEFQNFLRNAPVACPYNEAQYYLDTLVRVSQ